MPIPGCLNNVDLCWIRVELEFQEDCRLPRGFALHLRRELLRIGRELLSPDLFQRLFDPPLPTDPDALRRFQRPSPGFVLKVDLDAPQTFAEGDEYALEVLFCGKAIQLLEPFLTLVRALVACGLHHGTGRCDLVRLSARQSDGTYLPIWTRGQRTRVLPHPILSAAWLLELSLPSDACRIELVTPARLLSHGKPVFRPDFMQLFPFMLRRVGAMLYHWCQIDAFSEVDGLLTAARSVDTLERQLDWHDWRCMQGGGGLDGVGGVCGTLVVRGAGLAEIGWVLQLSELFHVGRLAAYGSGAVKILPFPP